MREFYRETARDDFNRARGRAFMRKLLETLGLREQELLSLHEVRQALRPRGETYMGMQQVPLERIVGSEGRYREFTREFLPRYEYLRSRWQSVDLAHLTDVILPPIKLYQIGGYYFVRDGNHRVSVARTQGVREIDAEVVRLDTEVAFEGETTHENLKRAVIRHEQEKFMRQFRIERVLGGDVDFAVTATGRYDELANHIYGHKYFMNRDRTVEIPVDRATVSWYEHVYRPIIDAIGQSGMLSRFPGRTATDLYLWVVRHWHALKERYGDDFPLQEAARDYQRRFGSGWIRRLLGRLGLRRAAGETDGDDDATTAPTR